ncbi:MAG: C40 family peptidase [Saprospiraceae bacterium]|nr:C40 family peptidase [Saprospiraceae bacterium]
MTHGICPLSTVAIRNSASQKSEMISQLLYGELVEVLERKGRQWVKVRCAHDNLVGWVATNQLEWITPSEFESYQDNFAFVLDVFQALATGDAFLPLTLGARLPNFDGLRFAIGEKTFNFPGQAVFPKDLAQGPEIIQKIARKFLNAPYLWGGRSPFGVDGPGLIQVVFGIAGYPLPREASQQVEQGENVDFAEQAKPADLAFFENQKGRITHTGIVLPEGKIIHVHGKVRIDKLDHYGIFSKDKGGYTHRLRIIKRLIEPAKTNSQEETAKNEEAVDQQIPLF